MTNSTIRTTAAVVLALFLAGAGLSSADLFTPSSANPASHYGHLVSAPASPDGVVEVTVQGMSFQAPDKIPSGWTTFRLSNRSDMIHFADVERLPDGITEADQQADVAPVFQEGMDLLNAGRADEAMAAFGRLPKWFSEVVFKGGPGLVAAGETAETTVFLEPGTYLLECYVKTGGVFHSFSPSPGVKAMVHQIVVTEETSTAVEPTATINLTISSERGIEGSADVAPGRHTVAVRFDDQTVHEHFLGHDVHLARLSEDTDLNELAGWMDWTQPHGLETPAPTRFLGGTGEMPAGETAYFTVTLEPGRYAWVAEVPNPQEKNMLKTFTVASEVAAGD